MPFIESEALLSCSQPPAIGPYPSLEYSIPRYSLICRNILILPQHERLFHADEVDHPRRRTQSLCELQVLRRACFLYFSGAYLFNDVLDKCAVMLLFIFGPVFNT